MVVIKGDGVNVLKKRIEFPMLELILITILLAMLAFVALPKVANIGTEARIQTLNATVLNIESVNRLLYGRAVIKGIQDDELHNADNFGRLDADVHLVYGELQANKDALSKYIDSTLFKYVETDIAGQIRLYLVGYQNEACYITYTQAENITFIDKYLHVNDQAQYKRASAQVTSIGC